MVGQIGYQNEHLDELTILILNLPLTVLPYPLNILISQFLLPFRHIQPTDFHTLALFRYILKADSVANLPSRLYRSSLLLITYGQSEGILSK